MFLSNVSEGYMCTFKEKAYNMIRTDVKDIWKYCSQQRRLRLALAQAASGLVFIAVCLVVMFLVRRRMIRYKKMNGWLVVLGFNATLTGHIMAVGDAHVFPGFLTPVLTQLFFPKPPTTFPTCFCRGERRKYAGKKVRLNRGSNSQPPDHESDTLTTEPPRRDKKMKAMLKYLQRDEFPLQFLMFLSHCSADDELFINYILPTLSQSMKEVTKTNRDYICLSDKHFRPGHTIVEEVMRCIEQSAVVVLIISNKYIKSQWCDMEAKEAATQQKPVILILTENIEEDKMSPVLKQLFNRYTRFKCFTTEDGKHEVSPTWNTLSSSVLELATDQVNV